MNNYEQTLFLIIKQTKECIDLNKAKRKSKLN